MKIFVINLERSVKRRIAISKQLNNMSLKFEIFNAVDGDSLSDQIVRELCATSLIEDSINKGQVACALSHIQVYKKMISDGIDVAVVLEDDVVLSASFPQVISEIGKIIKKDEVILLHTQTWDPLKGSLKEESKLAAGHKLNYLIPSSKGGFGSSAAYVIPSTVAKKMAEGLLPLFTHADGWVHFMSKGLFQYVRCVFPYPVHPAFFPSDIPYISLGSFRGKLKAFANYIPGINKVMELKRRRDWKESQKEIYFVDEPPVPASVLFKED